MASKTCCLHSVLTICNSNTQHENLLVLMLSCIAYCFCMHRLTQYVSIAPFFPYQMPMMEPLSVCLVCLDSAVWCLLELSCLVYLFLMQALQPLHARGRGHCDMKQQNIRIVLGDNSTILSFVIVDLGGSVIFQGKRCYSLRTADYCDTAIHGSLCKAA